MLLRIERPASAQSLCETYWPDVVDYQVQSHDPRCAASTSFMRIIARRATFAGGFGIFHVLSHCLLRAHEPKSTRPTSYHREKATISMIVLQRRQTSRQVQQPISVFIVHMPCIKARCNTTYTPDHIPRKCCQPPHHFHMQLDEVHQALLIAPTVFQAPTS